MFSKTFLAAGGALALAQGAFAAIGTASEFDVANTLLQYQSAGLIPDPIQMDWVDLQGTLSMKFGNDDVTSVGQKLSQEQVQPMPTFTIAQTSAAGSANTFEGKNFTVAFLDANYPGAPLDGMLTRHYLGNDFTVDTASGELRNSTPATSAYAGPGPASGSGPHRYVQLVFEQFANFTQPQGYQQGGLTVGNMSLSDYYTQSNLGKLVAANYIIVEVGTSTVSASSTAAVPSASVAAYVSSMSKASGTSTGSSTGSAASASNTSGSNGQKDGASPMAGMSALAIGASALLGAAALLF